MNLLILIWVISHESDEIQQHINIHTNTHINTLKWSWSCFAALQVKEAKVTEAEINDAREHYRPAAARGSLLYFIMNDLNKIHPMYQFSLKVAPTWPAPPLKNLLFISLCSRI